MIVTRSGKGSERRGRRRWRKKRTRSTMRRKVLLEDEREENKAKGRRRERTSRPKASNGQRFPRPAQLLLLNESFLVFIGGSGAAAPIEDKVL